MQILQLECDRNACKKLPSFANFLITDMYVRQHHCSRTIFLTVSHARKIAKPEQPLLREVLLMQKV